MAKWILIVVAAYIGWRFLNGWLNQGPYNVQSSNYISPSYPQVPFGYASAPFGVVGWGNGYGGYQGWSGQRWRGGRPRVGQPGGSTRW